MLNKISAHPCLKNADEFNAICDPLNKINISYFGYAFIDKEERFSGFTNNPNFLEHYLKNHYYKTDIQFAKAKQFANYLVEDSVELTPQTKKINQDAKDFGIQHFFSIVKQDNRGRHYYYFANNSASKAINQFYINNVDLLNLFIDHFNACLVSSKNLSRGYDIKFTTNRDNSTFCFDEELHLIEQLQNRENFIESLNQINHQKAAMPWTPQQLKCIALLARGLPAKLIAQDLNLSKRTVENHLARVRRHLNCRNSKEIIAYYFSQFIARPSLLK